MWVEFVGGGGNNNNNNLRVYPDRTGPERALCCTLVIGMQSLWCDICDEAPLPRVASIVVCIYLIIYHLWIHRRVLLLCENDGSVLPFGAKESLLRSILSFYSILCVCVAPSVSVGYYTCTVARVHPVEMLRKMASSSSSSGVGIWEQPATTANTFK